TAYVGDYGGTLTEALLRAGVETDVASPPGVSFLDVLGPVVLVLLLGELVVVMLTQHGLLARRTRQVEVPATRLTDIAARGRRWRRCRSWAGSSGAGRASPPSAPGRPRALSSSARRAPARRCSPGPWRGRPECRSSRWPARTSWRSTSGWAPPGCARCSRTRTGRAGRSSSSTRSTPP